MHIYVLLCCGALLQAMIILLSPCIHLYVNFSHAASYLQNAIQALQDLMNF